MAWKQDNFEDNHGSLKRPGIHEEQKDFLSDLPDEILLHILSFLSTRDALKTVMLRRFGNLWCGVPVLDFNQCTEHDCHNGPYYNKKFLNLIRGVLKLNTNLTLDKLRLRFSFHKDYISMDDSEDSKCGDYANQLKTTASEINMLVQYALSKQVKVIDLDLLGCGLYELLEDYTVPESVLRNEYLTELRLAFCNIEPQGEIKLRSLKVLSLTEIELSDKIMASILIGCPNLEELSLIGCWGLGKLESSHKTLKKLSLALHMEKELIISCPFIVSLEISGCIDRAVLLDVRSVIEASISLSTKSRITNSKCDDVNRLLQKFSQCHTFKPCTSCILVLSVWDLTNVACPYFNWKKLVLHLSFTKWQLPGISLLLRRSQYLETLIIHILPVSDRISKFEERWIQDTDFNGESYWNSNEANGTFYHLKNISINGNITEPYVLQMVKYLLRGALVLEKMIITSKNCLSTSMANQKNELTSKELQDFSKKLSSFPRSSSRAAIQFK